MANNMEIWNRVCETDPNHTKKVNSRGGFTAIDAMYQIQTATEAFGPAGKGWGWYTGEPIYPGNGTVVIKVTLWHGDTDNSIEQYGQKSLGRDDRPDEDAYKKCVTDGITKCLSYLGFNADVFLGKFDDNKYVQDMTRKFAPSDPEWDKDKALFEKELGVNGLEYADVAAWCESLGRRQPRNMTSDQRSRLLDYINSDAGKASYTDWLSANQ
jgi:hypothetical protein